MLSAFNHDNCYGCILQLCSIPPHWWCISARFGGEGVQAVGAGTPGSDTSLQACTSPSTLGGAEETGPHHSLDCVPHGCEGGRMLALSESTWTSLNRVLGEPVRYSTEIIGALFHLHWWLHSQTTGYSGRCSGNDRKKVPGGPVMHEQSMNHIPQKNRPRCYVKSPTVKDTFRPIPGLISCAGPECMVWNYKGLHICRVYWLLITLVRSFLRSQTAVVSGLWTIEQSTPEERHIMQSHTA